MASSGGAKRRAEQKQRKGKQTTEKRGKQGSKRRKQRRRVAMASGADKYRLYEESVQVPEADISFVRRVFKNHFGRQPRRMREDFCGTAVFSCEWARTHKENRAWGVDLDPEPLDYCRQQHLPTLSASQRERVKLIQGDVLLTRQVEPADVTVAFNFSYFIFQDRALLLRYLRAARATLADEGLFMLDAYGGADAQRTMTEPREQDGFDYVWDQHRFDPITHRAVNHIHFEFPDGSRLKRAFSYDWRLWSLPELRDALLEAGFDEVEVYWEGTDHQTGEGNGVYHKAKHAPDDPAWVAYIAALRRRRS